MNKLSDIKMSEYNVYFFVPEENYTFEFNISQIIKINIYMKKFFIKFKECFCDFIGGILEDEYIDMCMKQEYLNKVNTKK